MIDHLKLVSNRRSCDKCLENYNDDSYYEYWPNNSCRFLSAQSGVEAE